MGDELTIIPSREADWLPLARTQKGRLFRKHILSKGELIHPKTGEVIQIDDSYLDTMVANFNDGVCDIVQVPLAGAKNEHSEAPERNIGEVIDLKRSDDKLFATIDVRDPSVVPKMGSTILGASALLSPNYKDTRTGRAVGPALLHVCATNRPYVLGLDDYEEMVAATSDNPHDVVVLSAAEGTQMTRDELLAELRDTHGIDVAALMDELEEARPAVALTQELGSALVSGEVIALSHGQEMTLTDVRDGIIALAHENTSLGEQVTELTNANSELSDALEKTATSQAETVVDSLIGEGRIEPAKRETFIKLCLEDFDTFQEVVPDNAVVELSAERGTSQTDADADKHDKSIEAEVERIINTDAASVYVGKK